MKHIQYIGAILLITGFLYSSCKKADEFYETLESIPELDNSQEFSYKTAYTVGDTMVLYGRLDPAKGLVIHIGDAQAPVVDQGKDSFFVPGTGKRTDLDKISVVISENMGVGPNRPVTITMSGYTISGSPIEIFSREGGYLRDSVKLGLYYSMLYRSVFFNHVGGKGSVYFYGNNKIECLKKGAVVNTLLTAAAMKDENGAFVIQTMMAGTVDAQEKTIYFSALTTDNTPDNATNNIYRLCRYDITAQQLVTLNRTVIPKTLQDVREAHYQPFEGAVAAVKIPGATAIYADNTGNVYMRLNGKYAIVRLKPDGNIKYVFKNRGSFGLPILPGVWDTVNNRAGYLNAGIVPGQETTEFFDNIRIAPDEKLMYTKLNSSVRVFDLDAAIPLYQLVRPAMTGADANTVVTGAFSALTGGNNSLIPVFWGFMPLTGERLVQLNYQEKDPTFTVLDFSKSRADYYAPGRCETGVFKLRSTDILLNYDEQGHLYMTANDGAQVVTTALK